MTRILLMNIPAASLPTDYPPVAISRVIEGIDPSLDCDASFFDLDYYRPAFEEIKKRVQIYSPHIIGFSATLTTSYAYLKKLSNFIKEVFPDIIQILGGEMAVISNIVILKTKVDFCCVGESEPTFSNLIKRLKQDNFKPKNMEYYMNIKGLVFFLGGKPYFSGYEKEYTKNSLKQLNYKLLSEITSMDNYIHRVDGQHFKLRVHDLDKFLKLLYPDNVNRNLATVFASKGCVNKCTFCHRYLKGYRVMDVEDVINYIENLKKDLNVGMILFSEENFGIDRKSTSKLVEYLKTAGLNWAATAVRVKTVNEETIKTWREAGCVTIHFGIESFSQKMLDVMEKNATVEENLNAIRLCNKYKIFTIPGAVIGMPGETEETIQETIDNWSTVIPDDINFPFEMYINYVQAIPGTPLYEYARRIGVIGQSLKDEEKYIEGLYNINADEVGHYLNFTDYEKAEVAYWRYYVPLEVTVAYIKKHGYVNILKYKKTKAFRVGLIYILFPKKIRKFLLKYLMMARFFGIIHSSCVLYKKISMKRSKKFGFENINISLRKINQKIPVPIREDEIDTAILREGW